MKKNFMNSVKMSKPGSNIFDLTHDKKLSCQMGQLVPVMLEPTLPGDRFGINCESLIRFAPLIAPMMHRVDVTVHYFFVPNRLVWPGWEDFITNGGDQPDTPLPVPPAAPFVTIEDDGTNYSALMDYMGVPPPTENPTADTPENISALPFAAYQLIWNEYYRDQNLQQENPYLLNDGDNTAAIADLGSLHKRAWEHDYFTSCLPFAQKGASVDIPLGTVELATGTDPMIIRPADNNPVVGDGALSADAFTGVMRVGDAVVGTNEPGVLDPNGRLTVGSTTINDLRRSFKIQEWLEKMARGGTRLTEVIRSHFGVISQDARLQRPEYITGIKTPVTISEVLNTTGDTGAADPLPQGNMSGHAMAVTQGKYGSYYCHEHGYIIGIMSVMPKTAYQQGIPKHFLQIDSNTQYPWPSFAHLGEEEVQNKEIYGYTAGGSNVFGYLPRYSNYRYSPNTVHGEFRTTLDYWHMGRIFTTAPQLNEAFIMADPTDRIFAVTSPEAEKLYVHHINKITAVRPLPKYGTPTF